VRDVSERPATTVSSPVIFYDGVCGLCDRLTRFVLAHDKSERFRFSALQSPFAEASLAHHGKDSRRLSTLYVLVLDPGRGERLLERSCAVIYILRELGPPWSVLATALSVVPPVAREAGYAVVARSRYRIFGRREACSLPEERWRARFIDH